MVDWNKDSMKKLTKFFIVTAVISAIILVFVPVETPSLFESKEAVKSLAESDLIIILNPGGWGDASLEEAKDLLPIVEGIKDSLTEWGHNVVVIPYNRAKDGILNKFSAAKDFFQGYNASSEKFAEDLNSVAKSFPGKKIILAGLSNGAAFINETYEKVSQDVKDSLYAISIGAPFWSREVEDKNVLQLDNNGKDALSRGEIGSLLLATIKAPFSWLISKFKGEDLSLAHAFRAEGHNYSWSSPETKDSIVAFLENNIR